MERLNIFRRSTNLLHPSIFAKADGEVLQSPHEIQDIPEDQYILRMMLRSPETDGQLVIPSCLDWLRDTILAVNSIQNGVFRKHPYAYVTVRCGKIRSITDDEWHVDGFSMRIPHVPEQNYIWSNCYPTEILNQQFVIPEDFDPMKHNIHHFFQDRANPANIATLKEKHIAFIDPYVVHRRPGNIPLDVHRCFFRISFVPIEIRDDSCTPNPLLPNRHYGTQDLRKTLIRYA